MNNSNNPTTTTLPIEPDLSMAKLLMPFMYAKQHGVIILGEYENKIVVGHRENVNSKTLIELQRTLKKNLHLLVLDEPSFNHYLTQAFTNDSNEALKIATDISDDVDLQSLATYIPDSSDLLEDDQAAPVIRLLNALFLQAIKQRASDIHIETFEQFMLVRFRSDGVLRKILELPKHLTAVLISRLKVMSKLDIAEKRLPQDGRMNLQIGGHKIDVRLSILPANHGERVVLRLLDKNQAPLDLLQLGMAEHTSMTLRKLISKPHGLILITGPTGSGKTTTLYALLTLLNDASRNILTIEDPIEYDLIGIGQTAVNLKVGLSFAKGLRSILRQDPDVVMIGEIRDLETAQIAVQASLTGHLVLSTLHTNTAVGAITRLRDMGIEPFLLSSCLLGVIAQRLVRVLCPQCKKIMSASALEQKTLGIDSIATPQGCDACEHKGFNGRTGIYETLLIDDTLRQMIHDNTAEQIILETARKTQPSLEVDGYRRVRQGETTLSEVMRVALGE